MWLPQRPHRNAIAADCGATEDILAGIGAAADALKLSIPTVTVALNHLVRLGIAKKATGSRRDRLFAYSRYIEILSEGKEPLPSQ